MARPAKRQPDKSSPDFKISLAFHETFRTPAGRMVLDYLRFHYVQSVMTPAATDAELRYREGQRSIVGLIDTRMKEAHDG
jgi:hypothetical protein